LKTTQWNPAENEVESHLQLLLAFAKAATDIAFATKRAPANHMTILSDGILMWYSGKIEADSPIILCQDGVILNPIASDYFHKIECDPAIADEAFCSELKRIFDVAII
jgi:hypothetical protein